MEAFCDVRDGMFVEGDFESAAFSSIEEYRCDYRENDDRPMFLFASPGKDVGTIVRGGQIEK